MDETAEANQESGAAKLQERLQKRHQARIEDAERRKEAKESQSVAEEKGEYFSSTFSRERASIEELLSGCSGADRAAVTQKLEEATAKTVQLQKFLNDSMLFLTQYELRQAQAALQKLQTSLTETREEALPKKKFAFRARTKATDKASAPDLPAPDAGPPSEPGSTLVDGASEQCGFTNRTDERLTKTAEEIQKRDVLLTHLTNCQVRLLGSPSTLHLKHIDGCEILCGPVSSSVFVDHCRNSTLAFPCQQLRTHNTSDTRVYLHVTSRAIIEDCRGVSFAPFSWSYPTLEEDFAVSGLDRERNNWREVDDFNWLAAGTPSPNWTVIPEADRKTSWDS
ncbi:tubulin-specific chaperone C [Stegastes partitus]|uniref:Tubulin-specific chaperone C n=1 Tax=Stegastes partitus TaxID=144197 RepID=A0A9Y4U4T5_9TELE|nr:PREDICTED: tubulin-specific chaperone C [Stegastes partitus]